MISACRCLGPQPADGQDRDGAGPVLRASRRTFPFIAEAFTDAGYAGDRPATATIVTVDIVRKPEDQVGFAVRPRRWVVERFLGWIRRNRRLWKEPEATLAPAQTFLIRSRRRDPRPTAWTCLMIYRTNS